MSKRTDYVDWLRSLSAEDRELAVSSLVRETVGSILDDGLVREAIATRIAENWYTGGFTIRKVEPRGDVCVVALTFGLIGSRLPAQEQGSPLNPFLLEDTAEAVIDQTGGVTYRVKAAHFADSPDEGIAGGPTVQDIAKLPRWMYGRIDARKS